MTAENLSPSRGRGTVLNTSQSDIRSIARAEMNMLKGDIRNAISRTSDSMSKYHLQDALVRIEMVLDPTK